MERGKRRSITIRQKEKRARREGEREKNSRKRVRGDRGKKGKKLELLQEEISWSN